MRIAWFNSSSSVGLWSEVLIFFFQILKKTKSRQMDLKDFVKRKSNLSRPRVEFRIKDLEDFLCFLVAASKNTYEL